MQFTAVEEEADVEVTREDQSRINEFGRLNARKHEAKEEMEELKKQLDNMKDAESSVLLADEEPGTIKLMIGEAFVDSTCDAANAFIDAEKERLSEALSKLQNELVGIERRQKELKVVLYAKFGKTINLEE